MLLAFMLEGVRKGCCSQLAQCRVIAPVSRVSTTAGRQLLLRANANFGRGAGIRTTESDPVEKSRAVLLREYRR